jgi:signal transduction histidine kinase
MIKANGLIEDVFMNIIVNSIKHSTGQLTIWICLDKDYIGTLEYYRVIIEDNGPGIPDDLKAKVFNRLQRGATKSKGNGLGLHLVKTLVESMDGSVKVEDRMPGDPGEGSRFVIMLPASGNGAHKE